MAVNFFDSVSDFLILLPPFYCLKTLSFPHLPDESKTFSQIQRHPRLAALAHGYTDFQAHSGQSGARHLHLVRWRHGAD